MMLRQRQEEEEAEAEGKKRREQQQLQQQKQAKARSNVSRKLMYGSSVAQLAAKAPAISVASVNVYDETLPKDVPLVRRGGRCSTAATPFLVANDFYTWSSSYIETLPPEVVKQVALEEAVWREKECPRLSQVIRVLITPSA